MTLLAIEFDWDLLGVAATDADDPLVLPSAPTGPGLYRLRTETGPGLPWVHIGESADLSGRLAAIKAVDISTPQGRFRFDAEKRYPIMDYYFLKVAGKGGKPQYQVMDVLRDVRPE